MKTMKYVGMFLIVCILGNQVMVAQQNQGNRSGRKRMTHEQMSEMKANRLAAELALDDKTTSLFKDTYADYMNEMHQLWMKDFPKKLGNEKDKKQFKKELQTDAEVEKMIKKRFAQSRKMLDIREKYYDKFRKFLSPKQIQKVYEMDMKDTRRFHNEMNRRAGMRGHQKDHRPLMPKEVKAK